MMRTICTVFLSATLLTFCGGDSDDDDTPPPPSVATAPTTAQPAAPPGQVMVTVIANSTPPGAMVTGGGRQLGVTPLQTQVPVPAPQPGQTQTFAFTFQLAGHQPATINASPSNNMITITAALAPAVAVAPTPVGGEDDGDDDGDESGGGRRIEVNGHGGGPIFDNHTTTGTANVTEACVIDRLRVRLVGTHSYFGDLHITLRDPGGRSYSLARGGSANPFRTHTVRRVSGREARGRWTLSIADRLAQDSGVLRGWSMDIRCQ